MTDLRLPAESLSVGLGGATGHTYLTLAEVVKLRQEATGSPATFAESFWRRVDTSAGDDACWPWTGGSYDTGYGAVWLDGKSQKAHRVAWQLAHGSLGPNERVLHHCDNPPCCNPYGESHLFVGTSRANTADMLAKGRGNRDGRTHLRPEQIPGIRERYAAGETLKELALDHGVSHVAIWLVVNHRTWRDVA